MSQAGTRECNLASSVAFLEDNDDVSYSRSSWSYLCYAKHPAALPKSQLLVRGPDEEPFIQRHPS
eukprot:scaffold510_cov141-Skeletonema_marinoi.AAC.9